MTTPTPPTPYQAWNDTADDGSFAECPKGSPCSDLLGAERDACMDLGYCRGMHPNGITTPEEVVEAALATLDTARSNAVKACATYAQEATGWAVGDRVRKLRGRPQIVQVSRFIGRHPVHWGITPTVIGVIVKKNGTVGVRTFQIPIDTDGYWRHKWAKV